MSDTVTCAVLPACGRPAESVWRIQPRRDREPLSDDARRAVAWPGQAQLVDVPSCQRCAPRVRDGAVSVLSVVTIGEGETVVLGGPEWVAGRTCKSPTVGRLDGVLDADGEPPHGPDCPTCRLFAPRLPGERLLDWARRIGARER